MFFIFGTGSKGEVLESIGAQVCPRCNELRPFTAVLRYRYFSLFFIFGVILSRKYTGVCNVCGQAIQLSDEQVSRLSSKGKILFLYRWGLGILAGIIVVPMILAFLVSLFSK